MCCTAYKKTFRPRSPPGLAHPPSTTACLFSAGGPHAPASLSPSHHIWPFAHELHITDIRDSLHRIAPEQKHSAGAKILSLDFVSANCFVDATSVEV